MRLSSHRHQKHDGDSDVAAFGKRSLAERPSLLRTSPEPEGQKDDTKIDSHFPDDRDRVRPWGEHVCRAETPEEAATIGRKLDGIEKASTFLKFCQAIEPGGMMLR